MCGLTPLQIFLGCIIFCLFWKFRLYSRWAQPVWKGMELSYKTPWTRTRLRLCDFCSSLGRTQYSWFWPVIGSMLRADPTAVSKDCETPPLATAAKSLTDDGEMFRVMGELTEIPWLFKFERLRTLLCWEYNPPWVKEEFKKLLSTMPVDKVTSENSKA